MDVAFKVHRLNDQGAAKAQEIALAFTDLLTKLEEFCPPGRELALVKTNLETACFFAKKSMAQQPENQAMTAEAPNAPMPRPPLTATEAAARAEMERRILVKTAELMFNKYNEQGPNPWKTFDGRDVPRWSEITDQVRAKWIAAATLAQPTAVLWSASSTEASTGLLPGSVTKFAPGSGPDGRLLPRDPESDR